MEYAKDGDAYRSLWESLKAAYEHLDDCHDVMFEHEFLLPSSIPQTFIRNWVDVDMVRIPKEIINHALEGLVRMESNLRKIVDSSPRREAYFAFR